MTLDLYKFFAALIIFLVALLGALYPLRKALRTTHSESQELGEALASGIFLGTAFFHLLPDSLRVFNQLYPGNHYPYAEVIAVGAFLFLLFLERFSLVKNYGLSQQFVPLILASTLILHALIEGAALGIGVNFTEALLLFIAILAHKSSESYALCVSLLKHRWPLVYILIIIFIFAVMTPAGILLGSVISHSGSVHGQYAEGIFTAFAAGSFLYISTLHHAHFHEHAPDKQSLLEFGFLFLGALVMALIAIWA